MLIDFRFSNFRSFSDKSSLSMIASSQTTLNENLIRSNKLRILPSCVIYGANASGKSNIIKAMAVMREIVLSGSLEQNIGPVKNLELYPFIYQTENRPVAFEIEFIHENTRIEYGFAFEVNTENKGNRRIVSEFLNHIDSKEHRINLFHRDKDQVVHGKEKRSLSKLQFTEQLLDQFETRINANLDQSELYLARGFKSSINGELADTVIDFFQKKFFVVNDFTMMKTNLTFEFEESPDKDILIWNKTLERFVHRADFGPQKIAYLSKKPNNEESANVKLVSVYEINGKETTVPAELMESRGTLKLIDFAIPFQHLFQAGGVLILDEFDSAIHPEIIKGILAMFNDPEMNRAGSQLVFTTHNPIYLSNKIFRRDQIRFVEKDPQSFRSVIYSLADFGSEEVRNDQNYLINYFKGNYGALPYIDFSSLFDSANETEE